MSFPLLRRLMPSPITTSPAPPAARGTDVAPTPQRPGHGSNAVSPTVPAPGSDSAAGVLPRIESWRGSAPRPPEQLRPRSLSTPPAHASMPLGPPSYTAGICHHDFHGEHDGQRVGVVLLPDGRTSWLACHHHSRSGA